MKDVLALPTFILALCSFVISVWTAYKIGRLDFERRRQDFLTRCADFQSECRAKIYELELLQSRLDPLQNPGSYPFNNEEMREKWEECRERLVLRIDGLSNVIKIDEALVFRVEHLPRGLRWRVEIEELVGGEERNHRAILDRHWKLMLSEWEAEVAKIEKF